MRIMPTILADPIRGTDGDAIVPPTSPRAEIDRRIREALGGEPTGIEWSWIESAIKKNWNANAIIDALAEHRRAIGG